MTEPLLARPGSVWPSLISPERRSYCGKDPQSQSRLPICLMLRCSPIERWLRPEQLGARVDGRLVFVCGIQRTPGASA